MEYLDRWVRHSPMSNPRHHAADIVDLPSDASLLNDIIHGLLVHTDWLTDYGFDETCLHAGARETLPTADRIDQILRTDRRSLLIRRPPHSREIGTCRDFALLLCSFLRCKGIPSRLRCGFASYLGSDWEDHWVCEYWDERVQEWRLSDAQIDEMLRKKYGISFDPSHVPRTAFLTGGQAWLRCRSKAANPRQFGHGQVTGWWFLKINAVRDHCALNGRETSLWDDWRSAPVRELSDADATWLDRIAQNPEQQFTEIEPDWLR